MENTTERRELVAKELDFFRIKNNLKNFLRSQEIFKDYNFESSSLNVLLDILAYNTHYNAFYSNMVINESFLDTAIIRDSVVSLAKHLGYIPKSDQGSETLVDVKLNVSSLPDKEAASDLIDDGLLKVKKFDIFKNFSANETLYFYATTDTEFKKEIVNGVTEFWARGIPIREGKLKVVNFTVDKGLPEQRFILKENNIDTRSIEIKVQKSSKSTEGLIDKWYRETDLNTLSSDSKVFFVQEIYDGKQEIYFGDNIIGKSPDHGNVITVLYSTTRGSFGNNVGKYESNSSTTFSYSIENYLSSVYLQKDSDGNPIPTSGGAEKESISSIKYYAPKRYTTQDRAVTLDDYRSFLSGNYSDSFRSIRAWGGEENNPPEYGKVFISIRPKNSKFLSNNEKLNIENNLLKMKNVVSVFPKIVDPEYIYIIPNISIKYSENELLSSASSLRTNIMQSIFIFNQDNLSNFNKNFYTSELIDKILDIDPAIKSCNIEILCKKYVKPSLNRKFTYVIDFQNQLQKLKDKEYYMETSLFQTNDVTENFAVKQYTPAFIRDNSFGTLIKYKRTVDQTLITLNKNQGFMDYSTGKITLSNLEVYPEELNLNVPFSIVVRPRDSDFISKTNLILEIETSSVNIEMQKI